MEKLNKETTESSAGGRVLYRTLVLTSCVGLFLITVGFQLDHLLLCALDHLVP